MKIEATFCGGTRHGQRIEVDTESDASHYQIERKSGEDYRRHLVGGALLGLRPTDTRYFFMLHEPQPVPQGGRERLAGKVQAMREAMNLT